MVNHRKFLLALGVVAALSIGQAHADPISGAFSITGGFRPVNGATGAAATFVTATGVDFGTGGLSPGVNGAFTVTDADGDFAILAGTSGSIMDFSFSGPGSVNFPLPALSGFQSFAAVPTLSFSLTSIAPVLQSSTFLLLSGTGTFTWAGFDPTPASFEFSATATGSTFSFSASQEAFPTAVPEPASLSLLGAGLLALSPAFRRRRQVA